MSNNLNLSYSFTPNNNTIYVKCNNCITNNNNNNNNSVSNIVNTNPNHVYTYLNSPILLFTKTLNTDVDKYNSPYGIPFECLI